MRRTLMPVAAVVVLGLAACSSSTSKPAAATASISTTSTVSSSTPPASATTTAADNGLKGFGASWDTWDATRAPDDNAAIYEGHNTGYSPEAELPVTNGNAHDRYSVVHGTDTYVTSYQVNFRPGTGINTALADVLGHEFPSDAAYLWKSEVAGQCYEAEVKSATLAKAATKVGMGDGTGEVFIDFRTLGAPGEDLGYDPHGVSYASLAWGTYPNADAVGGC